jgi:hypothetical protein
MTGMEAAAIGLGTAVIKVAMKLWLQDKPVAADAALSVIDVLSSRIPGALDRRRFNRLVQHLEEAVVLRLKPLLEREFSALEDNEKEAATDAVRHTFDRAALTDDDLFDFDLDAGYLDRYLRSAVPEVPRERGLSEAGAAFYDRLLRECAGSLVQITTTLPGFQTGALTELLRRETETLALVRTVLDRMPERHSASDFEADYRQQVIATLDRMRIFGIRLSEPSRRYPLSVAYISLNVSAKGVQNVRVDDILPNQSRLLIHGNAGAGKSTLLQWIAVRCASRDLPVDAADEPGERPDWNDAVPLFIPLRRYAKGDLPSVGQFLGHIGRHIADEAPPGWTRKLLESGRAVVLIDGVDELPAHRREGVREWLTELTTTWPRARYVVTSRPAAVGPEWLDSLRFTAAELQPMTPLDVHTFVHRWYDAMRAQCVEREEWEELDWYEDQLLQAIASRRNLRRIAETPLLCALLCALQRENSSLPSDRQTLYKTALEMLLGRWDEARGVERTVDLAHTEQVILLQDLAYWLLKNGETDADTARVRARIDARLQSLTRVEANTDDVMRFLLERPGLLRQPIADRVDFIHRTFQEYLAAKAAVEADEIGLLIQNAELDLWREVVVMAGLHVTRPDADRLLRGLLYPGLRQRYRRDYYDPLAVAFLENSPDIAPELQTEVRSRAELLIPPRTKKAADALAVAGDFVLDLLAQSAPTASGEEASWLIYTAARVGGEEALQFLSRFQTDSRAPVAEALLSAWKRFDVESFAKVVLAEAPLDDGRLDLSDPELVPGLQHLKNLRDLRCTFRRGEYDLAFVRGLRALTTLTVTVPSRNWSCLEGLPELTSLSLNAYGTSLSELPRLPGLTNLALSNVRVPMLELGLANVKGRNDLLALGVLAHPTRLELRHWPYLLDVSYLTHWWDSLEELVLADMWTPDLSPLADLTSLRRLTLASWHVPIRLAFLSALEGLEELELSRLHRAPDLRPLRDLPRLRRLRVVDCPGKLDLSVLTGKPGLEIEHNTSDGTGSGTTGAQRIGEGS